MELQMRKQAPNTPATDPLMSDPTPASRRPAGLAVMPFEQQVAALTPAAPATQASCVQLF